MALILFYVTFPDKETAEKISNELLSAKLIACANIHPMNSIYLWKGNMCSENEWVAILKTTLSKEEDIQTFILKNHPYETPCIIRWPVAANAEYEQWINDIVE